MEKNDNPKPELFVRFLSGDASDEEKFELERWADASEKNRNYLDELVSLWELTGRVKNVPLSTLLGIGKG